MQGLLLGKFLISTPNSNKNNRCCSTITNSKYWFCETFVIPTKPIFHKPIHLHVFNRFVKTTAEIAHLRQSWF